MPEDFEQIYNRYAKTVYTAAYQYLLNRQLAEDAVQETFLKLYIKQPPFRSESHRKAWLIRVAVNLSKNMLKSKKNSSLSFDESIETPSFDEHEKTDSKLDVERALRKLQPVQREIVYLYYYEQYSVNEIAVMLKMPEGTVKSHLSRARKALKEYL